MSATLLFVVFARRFRRPTSGLNQTGVVRRKHEARVLARNLRSTRW